MRPRIFNNRSFNCRAMMRFWIGNILWFFVDDVPILSLRMIPTRGSGQFSLSWHHPTASKRRSPRHENRDWQCETEQWYIIFEDVSWFGRHLYSNIHINWAFFTGQIIQYATHPKSHARRKVSQIHPFIIFLSAILTRLGLSLFSWQSVAPQLS